MQGDESPKLKATKYKTYIDDMSSRSQVVRISPPDELEKVLQTIETHIKTFQV
jgi:hypothetical protein